MAIRMFHHAAGLPSQQGGKNTHRKTKSIDNHSEHTQQKGEKRTFFVKTHRKSTNQVNKQHFFLKIN